MFVVNAMITTIKFTNLAENRRYIVNITNRNIADIDVDGKTSLNKRNKQGKSACL